MLARKMPSILGDIEDLVHKRPRYENSVSPNGLIARSLGYLVRSGVADSSYFIDKDTAGTGFK